MQVRPRRTDDYTEALQGEARQAHDTVRIDPPVELRPPAAPARERLITVHEGPVHRRHVGREPARPGVAKAVVPLPAEELLGEDERTRELDAVPEIAASERAASEEIEASSAPEAEAPADPPPAKPSIKLESGLQRAVDAHGAVTDLTGRQGRRDRPTEQFSTQQMLPVSGRGDEGQWARTEVGPMPVAPVPPRAEHSAAVSWLVVAVVMVLAAALTGGWLIYRALGESTRVAARAQPPLAPERALGRQRASEPEKGSTPRPSEPAVGRQGASEPERRSTPLPPEPVAVPETAPPRERVHRADGAAEPRAPADDATHVVSGTGDDPKAPWLALRSRPRPGARLRARMEDGTRVRILRSRRGWARLEVRTGPDRGRRGWASRRWLEAL